MNRLRVLLIAALTAIAANPSAHAFCQLPSPDDRCATTVTAIDVKVNVSMANLCSSTTGDCSTIADIERVTKAVVDEFFDDAGANIRFTYAGTTTATPGMTLPGAIHVYAAGSCDPGVKGRTFLSTTGGFIGAARIEMCPGIAWRSLPTNDNNNTWSYPDVLGHELMHALGFEHPNSTTCNQFVASRVNTHGTMTFPHRLFKDDINALQSVYGARSQTRRAKESTDGVNWTDGSAGSNLSPALTRYAACNTRTVGATFQSFAHQTTRTVSVTKYDSSTWSTIAPVGSHTTEGPTGMACRSNNDILGAWLTSEADDTGLQTVRSATSWGTGGVWVHTNHAVTTRSSGISATYDPATDKYLLAWRNDSEALQIKVLPDGDVVPITWPGTTFLRSADTVSIACGPTGTVGTDNCLLSWVHWDWDRFWYWANGHIDTSGAKPVFVLNSATVYATPSSLIGTPSLAYWSTSTFPWEVAQHDGSATLVSFRKPAGTSHGWADRRTFTNAGDLRSVNPALGSLVNGNQSEVGAFYHVLR